MCMWRCFLLLQSIASAIASHETPNILLIMMDDLGYTDINYNGGEVPTPTLNEMASNGIRVTYHYANTICSASRSSLLTGRYAWRTGSANLIYQQTTQHTSLDLPFISSVLKESAAAYKTALFGKWHQGYSSKDFLPFSRGFDETVFFESGATSYTQHMACAPWSLVFGPLNADVDADVQQALQNDFTNGFCSFDLWNTFYQPMDVDGTTYSERLFTNAVKTHIREHQDDEVPFFIYYAMPTPHWPLETPPKEYAECNDDDAIGERRTFCNVLMYGDELIAEIIATLKAFQKYDDTVIIFLSDNGPNPNWQNGVNLPLGYGQTLPLRGAKGSTFEGGIRTPAIVSGGYVEKNCARAGSAYSHMVHISDWFATIMGIANIDATHDAELQLPLDLDGINLWPSICHNDDVLVRERIEHFEMADVNDESQGFKASYLRTKEWKLVINPALSFIELDSNKYWVDFDDEYTEYPPAEKYATLIQDEELAPLFRSACYDAMSAEETTGSSLFAYDEVMLFRIADDNIEACNLAAQYPDVVQQLSSELFSEPNIGEFVAYNSEPIEMSKQGSLAQIDSYSCSAQKAYHLSWQEDPRYADENAVSLSWTEIFSKYIESVSACKRSSIYYELSDGGLARFLIVGAALLSLCASCFAVSVRFKETCPWKLKSAHCTESIDKRSYSNMESDERTLLLPFNRSQKSVL